MLDRKQFRISSERTPVVSSSKFNTLFLFVDEADGSLLSRWIPDNVSVSLCSVPPVGLPQVRVLLPFQRSSLVLIALNDMVGRCRVGQLDGHPGGV